MPQAHYFYSRLNLKEMETIIKDFQEKFDEALKDLFSDEELESFEAQIDEMAAVFVQPILADLSFEDLYADPQSETEQSSFFSACRSSISIENLPYFDSNPFQVTYLKDLLKRLDQVLIDCGGVSQLQFKEEYLHHLSKFRDMDSLLTDVIPKATLTPKTSLPVGPMDFLVRDVYIELLRIETSQKLEKVHEELKSMPPAFLTIFMALKEKNLQADELATRTKLNLKVFGDSLERLKFFLRRINEMK
jgi:hypothetical protein